MQKYCNKNGYRTGIFGKWHLGDNYPYLPENRGFEVSVIHGGGGVGQTPDFWNNDYFDDTYFRNGKPEKFEGYCTDIWFDEALKFIESSEEKPFFCYIATNAPHGPFHVPQKYIDMYQENEDIPNPNFYGMITNVDENLGTLREKLAERGISDNTILIFMTDNGSSAGIELDKNSFPTGRGFNAGMRGRKGSAYEGGHRVPFFISWPEGNMASGKDVDHITSYTDVVPTLLDMCNIEYAPKLAFEGESLLELLKEPTSSWKSRTLITDTQRREFLTKWKDASIMTDQWRLIRGEELYDMDTDPGQTTDISSDHPEIVEKLRSEYESWWTRVSQKSDLINPIPVGFNSDTVLLTCHDIHGEDDGAPAWNQEQVRLDKNQNGYWIIDVKEAGKYSIVLYRYPKEAKAGLSYSVPEGDQIDGGKAYSTGVPMQIQAARIQIGEVTREHAVDADAMNAVFEIDLQEGEVQLQSWLIDEKQKERSAYYAYICKL